jgi:hypothetical protein
MNLDQSTSCSFAALKVSDLPEQDEALFKQKHILASQIEELRNLIHFNGIPDYPVILCNLPDMRGCVYMESDNSRPLVFLDSSKAKSVEMLQDTYIHEAAHLLSNGQDHDFVFAVTHNTFRLMTGRPPSDIDYDYRACDWTGLSLEEAMNVSVQFAKIILKANKPASQLIEEMRGYISLVSHRNKEPQDDAQKLLAILTDSLKSFDSSH